MRRQMTFLGNLIRENELTEVVLTGYVEGIRDRAKQRETLLTYLSERKGLKPSGNHSKSVKFYNLQNSQKLHSYVVYRS